MLWFLEIEFIISQPLMRCFIRKWRNIVWNLLFSRLRVFLIVFLMSSSFSFINPSCPFRNNIWVRSSSAHVGKISIFGIMVPFTFHHGSTRELVCADRLTFFHIISNMFNGSTFPNVNNIDIDTFCSREKRSHGRNGKCARNTCW